MEKNIITNYCLTSHRNRCEHYSFGGGCLNPFNLVNGLFKGADDVYAQLPQFLEPTKKGSTTIALGALTGFLLAEYTVVWLAGVFLCLLFFPV